MDRSGPSVLVVDDDREVRQTVRSMLERTGHDVDEAATAAEALAAISAGQPDVVLLDLVLPDRYGLLLLADLRAEGSLTPVVVLTGEGSAEAFRSAGELGACGVVEKPVSLAVLAEQVRRAMATGRASGEADLVARHVRSALKTVHSREDVAAALDMSGRTVSRHVKEATGLTFDHYLRRCRIEAATCLLRDNAYSISEVAYEVGYETPQHFARAFRQERGMSPTEYRKSRHRGHNDATRDAGD